MQEEAESKLSQATLDIRKKDIQLAKANKDLHQARIWKGSHSVDGLRFESTISVLSNE